MVELDYNNSFTLDFNKQWLIIGILAQSKPAANEHSFYSAPIDSSASAVLNVANDGTGAAIDVALKDYDQKLTVGASTYKLHEGDVISDYQITVDTTFC